MTEVIEELNRRLRLWQKLQQYPKGEIKPQVIRDLGIYSGSSGIYRDATNMSKVSGNKYGVTISVLHTGRHYPDELAEDGLIYHYPSTERPNETDFGDISATKQCSDLELPLFVILPGRTPSLRTVKLGNVEDFDDDAGVFLISYHQKEPMLGNQWAAKPFQLDSEEIPYYAPVKQRPGQQKFRFDVVKNYGYKCALCSIEHPNLLVAAHIKDKQYNGSDDWQNGIILCHNHHAAFENKLIRINPDDLSIVCDEYGILVEEEFLRTKTGKIPHIDALRWKWQHKVA